MRLRIETNQAVVGFMDGAVVFVTNAEVQRQPRTHLEIVLEVQHLRVDALEVKLPVEPDLIARYPQEQIRRVEAAERNRQRVGGITGCGVVKRGGERAERQVGRRVLLVRQGVVALVLKLPSEQQLVPAARFGQVLCQVPDPGSGDIDVAAASIVVVAEAGRVDAGKAVEPRWVGKAEGDGKLLGASARKLGMVIAPKRKQRLTKESRREGMRPAYHSGVILALGGE